ncbi:MAG TPA: peptidoglycan-binding protein, partial [Archangium sp.]|nr:peptidoglycan-binding protein [Archangium sp.]
DKGSADGVQVGNTFTILRLGDTTKQRVLELDLPNQKKKGPEMPMENVALCLVTEVKERTSNCVLTYSVQEVAPGDRAVMRVNNGQPSAQR